MKKLLILVYILFGISPLFAQNFWQIKGVIIDSVSRKPVEFVAVALWQGDKAIDGVLSNEKGEFKFDKKPAGTYKILLSFIGYKPGTINNITVNRNVDLGNVVLSGETKLLEAVTVTAQATLVEDRIDKLVYNADKDISNRSGTAEDVLRKVPMLAVDMDGNVSLRGSENIRVLIDGKPSTIFAASIADALRQMPSDEIKSVEVITSPGARYDGEGSAGIINIITKKNTISGITGQVSMGVGWMGSQGNGSLNLRDKKWGLSFRGGGRMSYNVLNTGTNTRTSLVNGVPTYLTQLDNNKAWRNNGNYAATFDYDFSKKSSFTLSFRNNLGGNRSEGLQNTTLEDANRALVRAFDRHVDSRSSNVTYNLDATYVKRFDNPDQDFTLLAQWSQNNRNDNYLADQNAIPAEKSLNNGIDREITLQADYSQPFSKKVKLDIGGKTILRKVTSLGDFYNWRPEQQAYVSNPARSNFLDYDQDVLAGYTSFIFQLPKQFGLQAGTRYEYTLINADFKDVKNADIPSYGSWLPSVIFTKAFGKGTRLKASYNQRIQRPSIRFLNPFVNYSNTNDISFGNPVLRPELTNQFEVAYNTFVKANNINLAVFHRSTNNSITNVRTIERVNNQDITRNTYDNIGEDRSYGANLNVQLQPLKSLRLGGGLDALYVYLNNRKIANSGWNIGYRTNATYNFKNGYSVQAFAFQRSPSIQLQGRQGAFLMYSLSAKKDFKNKKGSLGLGVENPFNKAVRVVSNFQDLTNPASQFTNLNERLIYRRSIRIDFQYRFGKMEAGGEGLFRRNRKNINNDDLKREGGGDEGENNRSEGGGGRSGGR